MVGRGSSIRSGASKTALSFLEGYGAAAGIRGWGVKKAIKRWLFFCWRYDRRCSRQRRLESSGLAAVSR